MGIVKESLDEVSKSDLGRKIKEGVEEAAKTAKQSAESVSKSGERLGRTAAFKALSQVSWAVLVPVGTLDSVLLPAPRSRVPISGLSPSQLGGLGQIVAPRELRVNRPRAPACSQWLTPLGLAQNSETIAPGHLRS